MMTRDHHPLAVAITSRLLSIAARPGAVAAVSAALTRLGQSAGDAQILALAIEILTRENIR